MYSVHDHRLWSQVVANGEFDGVNQLVLTDVDGSLMGVTQQDASVPRCRESTLRSSKGPVSCPTRDEKAMELRLKGAKCRVDRYIYHDIDMRLLSTELVNLYNPALAVQSCTSLGRFKAELAAKATGGGVLRMPRLAIAVPHLGGPRSELI